MTIQHSSSMQNVTRRNVRIMSKLGGASLIAIAAIVMTGSPAKAQTEDVVCVDAFTGIPILSQRLAAALAGGAQIICGPGASASGDGAIATGKNASANGGDNTIAIGTGANTQTRPNGINPPISSDDAIAIGTNASVRPGPREIEYDMEQMARLLEVAHEKQPHVHLFIMTMMSTHGRVEAVLELFAEQIRKGLIYFNAPGRTQTTKKRAIVPVVPGLAPWLPKSGKVICYQATRKDGTVFVRPTYSIKKAFAHCLVDAGIVDHEGKPWGYPNALRHTIHTYLQTVGVPQAQIDAAAGHNSEKGSGRNYTHLRPEYLKDFVAAVESYWTAMDKLTTAHRRSQVGPKR